jgi:hypothetical protein
LQVTVGLYSYVVARDYGFAPNPFGGVCTLATCKPEIRRLAQIGDWIVGTGSAKHTRKGNIVYAMKVAETMSFDAYWDDPRFQEKKPNLRASRKLAFGDNIYHSEKGAWSQLNSHHSLSDGSPNPENIGNDTQANRLLVATQYAYWGGTGPEIPGMLRDFNGHDLCIGRGYKHHFPDGMEEQFISWFLSLHAQGCLGRPIDWTAGQ